MMCCWRRSQSPHRVVLMAVAAQQQHRQVDLRDVAPQQRRQPALMVVAGQQRRRIDPWAVSQCVPMDPPNWDAGGVAYPQHVHRN